MGGTTVEGTRGTSAPGKWWSYHEDLPENNVNCAEVYVTGLREKIPNPMCTTVAVKHHWLKKGMAKMTTT